MRKLTPEIIRGIQKRKAAGATNHQLKDEFGVSYGSVVNACKNAPSQDPESIKTLKQMLEVHRARLRIAIGNEAKIGQAKPSTDRISREIERISSIINNAHQEPEQIEPDDIVGGAKAQLVYIASLKKTITDPRLAVRLVEAERACRHTLALYLGEGRNISDATFVRLPQFTKIFGRILDVLKNHPEALVAVTEALESFGN